MNENSEIIEIQGTAEGAAFTKKMLYEIIDLGEKGIFELIKLQKNELNI